REVRRADVEPAVLVLAKTLRPRDHHGADRVGALDVTVVVDLDAPQRLREPERLRETGEQTLPRRCVREVAAERLARIGKAVIDQILLLTAPRHRDLDLMAALDRERLGEQRAIGPPVRQEDAARRWLVIVELGEKRAEHLAGLERAVGLGKVGAVAPVLAGAE